MPSPDRLQSLSVQPPATLSLVLVGGKTISVDLSGSIARLQAFTVLEDPAFFARAEVVDHGWTVEWPNGLSMSSERLYRMAKEQSGKAFPLEDFRAWMERNGLSLSTAAKSLGLTRRTIAAYSSGARPVPRYIGLACKGWEVERRGAA
jgi:hypothetical protein